ncbi:MAG: hypothetical protein HOD97_04335 [Candidatus Marinimicrobia bacterium]|jgi:SMC interacting uncharacterized protein involved in chromosome segregation|nr:hypothetical protein [Candidatus Neomarinimicrobiota bacterium]MBT3618199.1 hypothetical protein [Candidatus Neomarinimicrobiota bacterium]MBT3828670.1 hypothetical protein [Candidatus Neomarinimicrobiota bacterium]MBT3996868.1 hypothetical protein [Candidatus Neomarinimicrobiota bacterium]MBT4280832.1 hypothetical protein [Candidatus Neomarinimicrobiota bacterium]
MNIKDKIIFSLLTVLIIVAVYFQYVSDSMQSRMVVLNEQDHRHIGIVDSEFREDLRKLNLKFEGRGKHLRRAQAAIVANTDLIMHVADSLTEQIENVQWNLNEHSRKSDRRFQDLEQDLLDLQDSFDSYRRKSQRKIANLEQSATAIEKRIKEIEDLEIIQKEKAKVAKKKK